MLYIVSGFNLHQKAIELADNKQKEDDSYVIFFPDTERHPLDQSKLGADYLKAAVGRDLYVVTYSDHILNGARLKATQTNTPFKAIFYDKEGKVIELDFNKHGVCTLGYPDGFFDQASNDVSSILRANLDKRKNNMS